MRTSSADKTYVQDNWPLSGQTVGLRVSPATSSARTVSSKRRKRASQLAEQTVTSSIRTLTTWYLPWKSQRHSLSRKVMTLRNEKSGFVSVSLARGVVRIHSTGHTFLYTLSYRQWLLNVRHWLGFSLSFVDG